MRHLSNRETDVLRLLAEGLTNKEIASHLGLATPTVNQHLRNLLLKLNLHNRTQLAVVAVREGLA